MLCPDRHTLGHCPLLPYVHVRVTDTPLCAANNLLQAHKGTYRSRGSLHLCLLNAYMFPAYRHIIQVKLTCLQGNVIPQSRSHNYQSTYLKQRPRLTLLSRRTRKEVIEKQSSLNSFLLQVYEFVLSG